MQTAMFIQDPVETQQCANEYVVAEPDAVEHAACELHVEEDGVDWCAWWAEYAEMME